MASDVLIRRCTLTIRGRGGWGWGTDPHRYLDPALSAIEQAVERVLQECATDPDLDVRIVQPVRLAWRRDGTLIDEVREAFVEQIRRATEQAQATRPPRDEQRPAGVRGELDVPLLPVTAVADDSSAVARLLGEWSRSGRLPQIVASWPPAIVDRWFAALQAAAADPRAVELAATAVAAIADVVLPAELSPPPLSAQAALLVLSGALTAAAGDRPLARSTLDLATRRVTRHGPTPASSPRRPPDDGPRTAAVPTHPDKPSDGGPTPRRPPSPPQPRAYPDRLAAPGLPFLVLIQLSRIGYLDDVWACVAATGLPQLANVIAAGLTGKALPPPDRGWRRRPTEAHAIAVAAGLPIGATDERAHALRDELTLLLAPIESALIALYAAGRTTGDEVVLSATPHGLVCGEAAGALPIAWLPDGADPGAVLDQLGQPPNRPGDLFTPLAAQLAPRRAYPHLGLAAVEHHLGAAVGTALGSLAQELWGTEAPDAPVQALHRLADLEVQLRIGSRSLTIAVPRGQRWLDLRRVGLLDRWSIPWGPAGHWELVTW